MRFLFTLALLMLSADAFAQEWSRFRGPNGTGVSPVSLPTQWTEKDYLWKIALPGRADSSPIAWQDHLYVTSAENKPGKRLVYCIDVKSGKQLRQRDFSIAS